MRDFDMHRHEHRRRGFCGHRMGKPILLCVALFVALGLIVMTLWNAVLPGLLGVKEIGFWQSLGMLALCRILFGGLGFRPGMFGKARRRMHERWMQMTPEQREAFMRHRREKFGFGHRDRCGWHSRWDEKMDPRPQPQPPVQPVQPDENGAKKPDAE